MSDNPVGMDPAALPEVLRQVSMIETEFDDLLASIRAGERRLEHVLNPNRYPEDGSSDKAVPREENSPLAERLGQIRSNISLARIEVDRWVERIEV